MKSHKPSSTGKVSEMAHNKKPTKWKRRELPEERYRRWWLGQRCRLAGVPGEFRKVTSIKLIGPPSFVYGDVWLTFEDKTEVPVWHSDRFVPSKSDVEIEAQSDPEQARSDAGTGVSSPNSSSSSSLERGGPSVKEGDLRE